MAKSKIKRVAVQKGLKLDDLSSVQPKLQEIERELYRLAAAGDTEGFEALRIEREALLESVRA